MAQTNKRLTSAYWLKPLAVKTPLLNDESITSWLVRAALNQGCDPLVLTQFYWSDYRLWTYDVDKGFHTIDDAIHSEMAILSDTDQTLFDTQNLTYISNQMGSLAKSQNVSNTWTLPLSKRNTRSRLGYYYCPLCMIDDEKAHLKIHWRMSWNVYCEQHGVSMLSKCTVCGMPYQPNLIQAQSRFINRCHHCDSRIIDEYCRNMIIVDEAYSLQELALQHLRTNSANVFDKSIEVHEWFEFILFLINIARRTAKTQNPNYMFYRLMQEMGIDIQIQDNSRPELTDSSTGLAFDYLSNHERIKFMTYAYLLYEKSLDDWLSVCSNLNITQNSFNWSERTKIPKAFMPVYSNLPNNSRKKNPSNSNDINPKSLQSVQKAWKRLQRKMEMKDAYEQQRIRSFN